MVRTDLSQLHKPVLKKADSDDVGITVIDATESTCQAEVMKRFAGDPE